ncbi:hypothetical protein INR21_29880, partial [Klebsiella pneumoniae]|nr:hypothetical protein [Klebsiella pneumoniae]
GTCIRIMTGAPVPEGCDAVVMQEETEQTEAGVRFIAPVKAGHVQRGDDVMGGHTREGLQQRYSFRRVQRRNTIEHLGEGC